MQPADRSFVPVNGDWGSLERDCPQEEMVMTISAGQVCRESLTAPSPELPGCSAQNSIMTFSDLFN